MPQEKITEKLRSAERRIAFAASQLSGVIAGELREAITEIRESLNLISPENAAIQAEGESILFVDDEEIIRRIGTKILSREGFKVLVAADGVEALGIYEQNRNAIKCVILDLVMPRMDGMQTFRHLRETSPDLGIILTTGYGEDEINRRFGTLKLQGFLRKPFTAATLVQMVRETIQYTEEKG